MNLRYIGGLGLALGSLALAGCGGSDDADVPAATVSAAQACQAVNQKAIGGADILTSAMVSGANGIPAYCKVSGRIAPKLNFEMRMPEKWNGKLYYQGGGGFNGAIPDLNPYSIQALKDGYLAVASDSGHQAVLTNTEWAVNDAQAANMWGSLSVPTVMATALKVVTSAYGQSPSKSYFEGCSNGGREGMMAMQRNPNLFDGVIVRAPAYNIVGFFGHWSSNSRALAAPGAAISNAKLTTLSKAVLASCDALDGITDGIVSNQAACNTAFKPATLRCVGGADTGSACFSDAQLASLNTIMSEANFGNAQTPYHDAPRALTGNEDDPGAWPQFITGNGNVRATVDFALTEGAIKGFIARDYTLDILTYSPYDQDLNSLFAFSAIADATSPDIRPFIARGGKVIFWHGGNDAAFPVQSTADYVQAASDKIGGKAVADGSVRFYAAPGVDHCFAGPGADTSNLLAALDGWVVANNTPGNLTASKLDSAGAVQFERPLCQYPQYARYTGPSGDANAAKLAANYTCVSP